MSLPKEDPRSESEKITEGKEEPKHLGEHTPETLTQEIVALSQTKPAFRSKKWYKRADHIRKILLERVEKDPRQYQGLLSKLDSIVKGGEM